MTKATVNGLYASVDDLVTLAFAGYGLSAKLNPRSCRNPVAPFDACVEAPSA
jgi:hypothetical protein